MSRERVKRRHLQIGGGFCRAAALCNHNFEADRMSMSVLVRALQRIGRAAIVSICASGAIANGPPSTSPVNAKRFITKVDADRDGRVSATEWRMQSMPLKNFRKLDRDRDGYVSVRELAGRPPAALDATKDGKLSAREMTFGKAAKKVAPASR